MSHPYSNIRQGKVEKSRVSKIAHRATGGRIEAPNDVKGVLRKERSVSAPTKEVNGDTAPKAKQRADRPGRKRGGRAPKGGKTVVNVITGGAQPPAAPPMAPPPGLGPMGPQGLAAKPPMPMPPAGGPPPGGMAPGPIPPMRKRGGRVNDGTKVFNKSMKEAGERPVQHDKGKSDLKDMNRKRVVTFATGGGVKTFMAGGRVKGPTEHKGGVADATKLPGGAAGGLGRLAKAKREARK